MLLHHDVTVCLPCSAPDGLAYECDVCYNATTGMRFWGFVNALINLQSLVTGQDSRLRDLRVQGYLYEMYKFEKNGSRVDIARSQARPIEPVQTDVHVPGGVWFLDVSAVVCTGVWGSAIPLQKSGMVSGMGTPCNPHGSSMGFVGFCIRQLHKAG
jgi:hypothetical protein